MRIDSRSDRAIRNNSLGLWSWIGGLLVAFALGVVTAFTLNLMIPRTTTSLWFTDPGLALAALRHRHQLPLLRLDLDLEDFQQLSSPSRGDAEAGGSDSERCIEASASIGSSTTEVQLCPLGASAPLDGAWTPGMRGPNRRPAEGVVSVDLLLIAEDARVLGLDRARVSSVSADSSITAEYFDELRAVGLPTPSYEVLRLAVNGTGWGTVALEGPPSVAMLSAAGLASDSVIVSPVASESRMSDAPGLARGYATAVLTADSPYGSSTFVDDEEAGALSEQMGRPHEDALALIDALATRTVTPSGVLDPEVWGRFLAITAFWRGVLSPDWGALTFAYVPATRSLIPVGTATDLGEGGSVLSDLMGDPVMQRAYVTALASYVDSVATIQNADADMTELEALYLTLGAVPGAPGTLRDALEINQARIRRLIHPDRTVEIQVETATDTMILRLDARLPLAVEILALDFGARGGLELDPRWVVAEAPDGFTEGPESIVMPPRVDVTPPTLNLHVPLTEIPGALQNVPGELRVVTRILGLSAHMSVPIESGRDRAWWATGP